MLSDPSLSRKRAKSGKGDAQDVDAEADWRSKRVKVEPDGGQNAGDGQILAHHVAAHYSARENQSREQRELSPIITLKKLNNWVKSCLIKMYAKRSDAVLDLACGKGGDLQKWERQQIGFYLGVDLADGSVEDARARYNGEAEGGPPRRQGQHHMRFPAMLACTDCFGVPLDERLAQFGPFDLCSCQFAFHYSFESEARARCALKNVAGLLRPGGTFIGTMPDANVIIQKLRHSEGMKFGNNVYSIHFDAAFESKRFPKARPFGIKYMFHLEDAVDCPEWLVPFPFLQALALEYGLQLELKANLHEFVLQHGGSEPYADLMRRILKDGLGGVITEDEWDAAYLYLVFAFRKVGPAPPEQGRRRFPGAHYIEKQDVLFLS